MVLPNWKAAHALAVSVIILLNNVKSSYQSSSSPLSNLSHNDSQTQSRTSGAISAQILRDPSPIRTVSLTSFNGFTPILYDDRPDECPPCFNCHLPAFQCKQFAECSPYDGNCKCPDGFGGDDCSKPVCGGLEDGDQRYPRQGDECACKDGWSGINCNVCEKDSVCDSLVPSRQNGTCYRGGLVVEKNFQMCDVTNRKILDLLPAETPPQVTFSCETTNNTCDFQFWIGQVESFYCSLDQCKYKQSVEYDNTITDYECEKMQCECVPGEMLCGKEGSVDIGEFLTESIRGPASFVCTEKSGCKFQEPEMNNLILTLFGDDSITLNCHSGECLHYTQIPGYERPQKPDNSVVIAASIAGVAVFIMASIAGIWYMARRSAQVGENGYIRLPDDEAAKLMTDHTPATLHFRDVSYTVNQKTVLRDIHGSVKPGQVMAIMGASGAGKTSFLDILARKNKRGAVSGEVYVNGKTISDEEFKRVVGYVDQEDTLMPTLTVYETVLYSALLRLPKSMSFEAKRFRVLDTMNELGILGIKDARIGEQGHRSISGGEKRRVSIACELVTSPSILFLDEPTSGLDSYNAYNVIESLVTLARNYNRTVIFTIHQPRSNIVALFDQLLLLAAGYMVYSGDAGQVQSYFEQVGHPCPTGFNVADYLVDLTMHAVQNSTVEDAEDHSDDANSVSPGFTLDGDGDAESQSTLLTELSPQRRPGLSINGNARSRSRSVRLLQEEQLYTPRHQTPFDPNLPSELDSTSQWQREHEERPANEGQDLDETTESAPSSTRKLAAIRTRAADNASTELEMSAHLEMLVDGYRHSRVAQALRDEIDSVVADSSLPNVASSSLSGFKRASWWTQFRILSDRSLKNLVRNPMLMLGHYCMAILLALLCGYLFYSVSNDIPGFQNRMGLFFFILALFGFSTLTSLNVFAQERIIFVRERANGYYSPITYFSAKVLFDVIPLRVVPPILMGVIIYHMVGLVPAMTEFLRLILILVLFNLTTASICLFLGIAIQETSIANLIGSLVMLFGLLFSGLLLNQVSIPAGAGWLQSLSVFHYAFEALLVNEMKMLTLTERRYGLDIEIAGAAVLSTFGFDNSALWRDIIALAVMHVAFLVLSYIVLHVFVKERR